MRTISGQICLKSLLDEPCGGDGRLTMGLMETVDAKPLS